MNQLSKEAIEAIEKTNCFANEQKSDAYRIGATEALTNPTIYQSAGLIKAQDILPETFKTEAVNTILVNALRFLNDEQLSHLLKSICQRNTNATQSAGLMTVEEELRFAEWCDDSDCTRLPSGSWISYTTDKIYTTTELLTIFRNQNQ